jgi:hypothetical protein
MTFARETAKASRRPAIREKAAMPRKPRAVR